MGWYRYFVQAIIIIVAIALLILFVNIMLKIALLAALIAFAYYWFMKAIKMRSHNRHWR